MEVATGQEGSLPGQRFVWHLVIVPGDGEDFIHRFRLEEGTRFHRQHMDEVQEKKPTAGLKLTERVGAGVMAD